MSQSSQISGNFVHQHPMRRIELQYMPEKTLLTTEDETLLKKYLELHDFEYHLLKKTEELYISFCEIEKQVSTLLERVNDIKEKLNKSVAMADKLSADTYIPAETNMEKIQENNASVAAELSTHHQHLQSLYTEVKYYQGILNSCIEATEEGSEKIYDEYSIISTAHSQNYEINTIDIVSLHIDYEKFCSSRDLCEERRDGFMNECDKVLNNYNTLNLETNALYNLWAEFIKRCELIQVVATLHHSHISSGIN